MKIGILTGNDTDAVYENAQLCSELRKLHAEPVLIDYQTSTILEVDQTDGLLYVCAGESSQILPNAVISRINEPDVDSLNKAKRFLDALESLAIPLTATATAVEICKDKMSTHDRLVADGVPTPRTAMPTSIDATDILPLLDYIEPNPNRPVIIKKIYGTKGIGVARAGTRRSALPFIQMLVDSNIPILAQQYIETKRDGFYRDIRHVVIGKAVVAAMLRESSTDFRTNLSLNAESDGGISDAHGRKVRLNGRHKELSIGAAMAVGADITGIDILPSIHGGAYVGDVNCSPGLKIQDITGINVAGHMAKYAVSIASRV